MSGKACTWRGTPLLLGVALALGMGLGTPAFATVIDYSLDVYTGSGSPPSGPYGTVELNDHNGPNVEVTLTLAAGEGMVITGAGAALTWALSGTPVVTITGLNATDFTVSHNATNTGNLDGTGSWKYEIDCTAAACGSGGNSPYTGTLDFTIDNVTLSDFTSNGKTAIGYYFASDICTSVAAGDKGCTGITGDIASDTTVKTAGDPVPEPASLALLGSGIVGLGRMTRRRKKG